MATALAEALAAVGLEMTLEVDAPHAAVSSVIFSVWPPPIGGSRPSSR